MLLLRAAFNRFLRKSLRIFYNSGGSFWVRIVVASLAMQTYIALVIAGTVLMVLEIFLPGGISGLAGGLLFLLAAWHAFVHFDGWTGLVLAIAAIVAACAFVTLVVLRSPRTSRTRARTTFRSPRSPAQRASPTPRCGPPASPRWADAASTS